MSRRRGIVLVAFAILMFAMIGMLGLVLDAGLLLAAHRHVQNAADAAALGASAEMLWGGSTTTAEEQAAKFVQQYNGLASSVGPFLVFPPTQGPYAGQAGYVEAIVTYPVQTAFIHVLGVNPEQRVYARAVATWAEAMTSGEGVAVLDPDARPGLDVSGGGVLKVLGGVYVNSEGGGVDENGQPINNGNTGFAARGGQPNNNVAGIYAGLIRVVGGVDKPENFKNIDPSGPNPLKTRQLSFPDPLLSLATPTVATGVDPTNRTGLAPTGKEGVSVTNVNATGLNLDPTAQNYQDPVTGQVTLFPGMYNSIEITGGTVSFTPGIYVLLGKKQTVLKMTGGTIVANGVMFYNTGHNYDPVSGLPDINDGNKKPPFTDGAEVGGITMNAGMVFTPIDTKNPAFNYSSYPGISTFDGMLFYQRRRNTQSVSIEGDASTGVLLGTLYAKWANFKISGNGTYDAQFLVGSMNVAGNGDVTLTYAGQNLGKAPAVFLVE